MLATVTGMSQRASEKVLLPLLKSSIYADKI